MFPSDSDADSFTHSMAHLKRIFFPLFVLDRIERSRLDVVKFGMAFLQYLHKEGVTFLWLFRSI